MPAFRLACLAYLSIAVPSSTLGLLWPPMRLSFHEPVGALGIVLIFGITASVVASAAAGHALPRVPTGAVVTLGILLVAGALAAEAWAASLPVFTGGAVIFGLGSGAVDAALNAHAAGHFGPRRITWMHAACGLGAIAGPALVTALLGAGLTWRWAYGVMAAAHELHRDLERFVFLLGSSDGEQLFGP